MYKSKLKIYRVMILKTNPDINFNELYHGIERVINKYKRKFAGRIYGEIKIVKETRDWDREIGFGIHFRVKI